MTVNVKGISFYESLIGNGSQEWRRRELRSRAAQMRLCSIKGTECLSAKSGWLSGTICTTWSLWEQKTDLYSQDISHTERDTYVQPCLARAEKNRGEKQRSRQRYWIHCATSTTKLAWNQHSPCITLQMVKVKLKPPCLRSLLWQACNVIDINILLFIEVARRYNTCPRLKEALYKDCSGGGGVNWAVCF